MLMLLEDQQSQTTTCPDESITGGVCNLLATTRPCFPASIVNRPWNSRENLSQAGSLTLQPAPTPYNLEPEHSLALWKPATTSTTPADPAERKSILSSLLAVVATVRDLPLQSAHFTETKTDLLLHTCILQRQCYFCSWKLSPVYATAQSNWSSKTPSHFCSDKCLHLQKKHICGFDTAVRFCYKFYICKNEK